MAPHGAGPGTRPLTQRVMARVPHPGQSAPWLIRVDQKQTGQWSRTVTTTRAGRSPARHPSADSECWAWSTASSSPATWAAKTRGSASRFRPRATSRRTSRPSASTGPGLVVTTATRWPASRRPSASARVDHPAPPALELLAVARPRVALHDAGPRLRAQAGAQDRVAGQPLEDPGEVRVVPLAEVQALPLLAHDLVEGRAGDRDRGQTGGHVLEDLQRRPVEAEAQLAQPPRVVGSRAHVGRGHELRHLLVCETAQPPAAVAGPFPRARSPRE